MAAYGGSVAVGAGMEPGARVHRGHVGCSIDVGGLGVLGPECGDLLRVPLVDAAEAAEFAFRAVKIAMVIAVARDETIAADPVERLDPLDHMHRKRQARDPRRAGDAVLHIEAGGGS